MTRPIHKATLPMAKSAAMRMTRSSTGVTKTRFQFTDSGYYDEEWGTDSDEDNNSWTAKPTLDHHIPTVVQAQQNIDSMSWHSAVTSSVTLSASPGRSYPVAPSLAVRLVAIGWLAVWLVAIGWLCCPTGRYRATGRRNRPNVPMPYLMNTKKRNTIEQTVWPNLRKNWLWTLRQEILSGVKEVPYVNSLTILMDWCNRHT